MWFLYIPLSILTSLLVCKSKYTSAKFDSEKKRLQSQQKLDDSLSNLALEFEDSKETSKTMVVAVEEIPLDNRYSDTDIKSEHSFSHSANASVEIVHHNEAELKFGTDLWKLLESQVSYRLGREIEQDIGTRIQREVNLTFHAAARTRVHYKVIWKQSMRWGSVIWQMGNKVNKIPFVVHYGLFAEVISIASDKLQAN
jgi:hypothetical protein